MNKKKTILAWVMAGQVVALLLVLVMFFGVHPDYGRNLPGGFRLASTNAYTTAIWNPRNWSPLHINQHDGVPVAAQISQVGYENHIVFGEVISSPNSELYNYEKVGFFILDTHNGAVLNGLTRVQMVTELNRLGITKVKMVSPWWLANAP